MIRRFVFLLALLALAAAALPVSAANDGGATFALGCDGFKGTGGSITLDRNNTGNAREAFIVSATDGVGNVIYAPIEDTFFVGGSVSWADSDLIPWTAAPQYNPLTLRVISRAGKGFAEQLISLSTGACESLPTYAALPEGVFVVDGDTFTLDGTTPLALGATSPEVPLNTTAPRPVNSTDIVDKLAGKLIVNTDNLSLRSGDGVEFTLVGIVDGGTVLIPLGHNAKFSWWYVRAGNIIGWAKAEFLIARGDLTGVPVVDSKGEITQPRFFLFTDAQLASAPSESVLPLCSIAGNLDYLITGRTKAADWYEIQTTCGNTLVKGWLPADRGAVRNPAATFIDVTG
jgi:uncharacterized protein YgiM (DUF1202 family)